jgi:hypothetical protein
MGEESAVRHSVLNSTWQQQTTDSDGCIAVTAGQYTPYTGARNVQGGMSLAVWGQPDLGGGADIGSGQDARQG